MRPKVERTPTVHSTFVATQLYQYKSNGSTNWHIDTLIGSYSVMSQIKYNIDLRQKQDFK